MTARSIALVAMTLFLGIACDSAAPSEDPPTNGDGDPPPPPGETIVGDVLVRSGETALSLTVNGRICAPSCGSGAAEDVTISDNEVFGAGPWPVGNNGLIFIQGGIPSQSNQLADNIRILRNRVHDIQEWETDPDVEHHACITIKSGDGPMEIIGNELYHCPSNFYFKYEWDGPILIEDNYFHDTRSGGRHRASNITYRSNLFVDAGSPDFESKSRNGKVLNNTFVNSGAISWDRDNDHESRGNVVFGDAYLTHNADHDGVYTASVSEDNCFIGPAGMLAVRRTGISIAQWKAAGHDQNSPFIVETDPTKVFRDPANGDYTLIGEAAAQCAGKGVS